MRTSGPFGTRCRPVRWVLSPAAMSGSEDPSTTSTLGRARVRGGFWGERLAMNRRDAISYQWEQLERTGCINNLRIAARVGQGFREGLFFSDSDAYKWLDAASRMLADDADTLLRQRVDELIGLLEAAQEPDGYLYTYNQILFPGERWANLQFEHEMYCLGHLIEAGVSHHEATGETRLLDLVRRSADLLVREFMDASPERVDGHEEIEIALLRLFRTTRQPSYLELARRLLERRGRVRGFWRLLLPQLLRTALRLRSMNERHKAYRAEHPEYVAAPRPHLNTPKIPRLTWPRLVADVLSGRNFQQNAPLRQQTVPVGHAVRFMYLETAAAMLACETADSSLRGTLERAWEHMVTRRMYVTGGLGSLPLIEGFGRDFELDPEVAYAETCAAIGCMLWNREMASLTGEPCYDDLFEWQLYNAASVGMGLDGRSYLYNNPLTCRGGIERVPWYLVPCCPSNLSRLWATLAHDVCRVTERGVFVAQYVGGETDTAWGRVAVESDLPWEGRVRLTLDPASDGETLLHMRLPSWADAHEVKLNGATISCETLPSNGCAAATACGYSPNGAKWLTLRRAWRRGDVVELALGMSIRVYRQDDRVPGCGGMVALARGPLVYCLESVDNAVDLFSIVVRSSNVELRQDDDRLGGIRKIVGVSSCGAEVTFVPYLVWGNRGPSRMTVFFRDSD